MRSRAGVLLLAVSLSLVPAFAADNQATGNIAGDNDALSDSGVFVLNSTGSQLALVKRAVLDDGTPVADLSVLPRGSVVKFLIYVNNDSSVSIHDLSVQDVLDPAFAYQTGTIRVDNTVGECAAQICDATEEAALFLAINDNTPLDDSVGADVASYTGGDTIDVGNEIQTNTQLDIAGDSVWAVMFTVRLP